MSHLFFIVTFILFVTSKKVIIEELPFADDTHADDLNHNCSSNVYGVLVKIPAMADVEAQLKTCGSEVENSLYFENNEDQCSTPSRLEKCEGGYILTFKGNNTNIEISTPTEKGLLNIEMNYIEGYKCGHLVMEKYDVGSIITGTLFKGLVETKDPCKSESNIADYVTIKVDKDDEGKHSHLDLNQEKMMM